VSSRRRTIIVITAATIIAATIIAVIMAAIITVVITATAIIAVAGGIMVIATVVGGTKTSAIEKAEAPGFNPWRFFCDAFEILGRTMAIFASPDKPLLRVGVCCIALIVAVPAACAHGWGHRTKYRMYSCSCTAITIKMGREARHRNTYVNINRGWLYEKVKDLDPEEEGAFLR